MAPRGPAGFNKGGALFVPLKFAQRYLGDAGKINTVDIVLADGADEERVAARIRAILPPGLDVHPPASATQLAKGTTTEVQWGLSLASVFAVVLAFIIIVNTFLMNVSERRPQIAILRAVGATRRQVVGMLLREALVLGILGTLLGCALGLAGGYLLMVAVTRLYVNAPPPASLSPLPFVLAIVFGPVVSLLAAAVPAWLTTRVTPLEAMQPAVAREGSGVPRWMPICGAGLLIVVAGLLAASIRGWLPPWLSIVLGALAVALFVLVIPALVRPLVAVTGGLLRPLGLAQIRACAAASRPPSGPQRFDDRRSLRGHVDRHRVGIDHYDHRGRRPHLVPPDLAGRFLPAHGVPQQHDGRVGPGARRSGRRSRPHPGRDERRYDAVFQHARRRPRGRGRIA